MRTFLINFTYHSGQSSNADFVLLRQESFPTSQEINKHIQSAAAEKGLQAHGPILWTGITELSETDETQFTPVEE
jgi:hypothetical protein